MTTSVTPDAGHAGANLSQRVARRRAELGLSLEEVGRATGIDPRYLDYLEHHAEAGLSLGSLLLLSHVLDTTPNALLGRPFRPRRRGASSPHPVVAPLSRAQCEMHLSSAACGRLVYSLARGPVAIPVNYEYTDGQIVLSTDREKASRLVGLMIVGFEVDRVADDLSEGWSVLVTGQARSIDDAEERQRLSSLGLDSWDDEGGHTLVAITPSQITGRVIVHGAPWRDDEG